AVFTRRNRYTVGGGEVLLLGKPAFGPVEDLVLPVLYLAPVSIGSPANEEPVPPPHDPAHGPVLLATTVDVDPPSAFQLPEEPEQVGPVASFAGLRREFSQHLRRRQRQVHQRDSCPKVPDAPRWTRVILERTPELPFRRPGISGCPETLG